MSYLGSVYNEDLDMVMEFWKAIHAPGVADSEEEANDEPLVVDFRTPHSSYPWSTLQLTALFDPIKAGVTESGAKCKLRGPTAAHVRSLVCLTEPFSVHFSNGISQYAVLRISPIKGCTKLRSWHIQRNGKPSHDGELKMPTGKGRRQKNGEEDKVCERLSTIMGRTHFWCRIAHRCHVS